MPIGRNTCQCANPPGGQADCPEDHLATCHVVNGVAVPRCLAVPQVVAAAGDLAIKNWVLSELTGTQRSLNQRLDTGDELDLARGIVQIPNGPEIRFSLPRFTSGSAGSGQQSTDA